MLLPEVTIGQAVHALTGNIPGSFFVRGEDSYENIVWDESLIHIPPTEEEVNAKLEELRNAEPMNRLKKHRDRLLQNCDWTQGADSPLSNEKKAEWATYRQALRDLTNTANPTLDGPFIKDVEWPQEPN